MDHSPLITKTLKHSKTVAIAAETIAKETKILDPKKAYICGYMHDIGKLFLQSNTSYKHPTLGYELLKDKYPEYAAICLCHPFPTPNLYDYFLHYCNNNKEEADKISAYIKKIEINDYILLIQLCDKISGIDEYMSIEDKFNWYESQYTINKDLARQNYIRLKEIKQKFDDMAKIDIYTKFHLKKK